MVTGVVESSITAIILDTTVGITTDTTMVVGDITVEDIMAITAVIEDNLKKVQENSDIATLFKRLSDAGPAAVFGGAVRDWVLGKTPRDIDIVLDCPINSLSFISNMEHKKNKFGGYHLVVGGVEFDVWNLDASWAFKADASFTKNLKTLTKTCFFNMDAVLFYLDTGHLQDDGFTAAIESKKLDIVYEPNPFPFLCVSKALCALRKYEMTPTDNLRRFIGDQMARGYTRKSFTKYAEMKGIPLTYEEVCLTQ
jgi:hypothetical protein